MEMIFNNGQEISGCKWNIQDIDVFRNDDGEISAGVNDLVYEVKATDTTLNKLAASIASQVNINPEFQGFSAIATTDGSGVINISIAESDHFCDCGSETAFPMTNGGTLGILHGRYWCCYPEDADTFGADQAGGSYSFQVILGTSSFGSTLTG